MNKLTIQINNLEALERLIGGDSEVEIEIRNSVVQSFAQKHLKPLAKSPEISTVLSAIKQEIAKTVEEKCSQEIATFQQTWAGSVTDVKLKPAIKTAIDQQVRLLIDTKLQDAVDESLKFWLSDAALERRVQAKFDYYTNDFIANEVRKRLDKVKKEL